MAEPINVRQRPAELGQLRRSIIEGTCPVLLDAFDVAVALDISERAAVDRFDNMVMAGDRWLIRAAEVRPLLLAMRPVPEPPKPERRCYVCDVELQPGQRRFCSPAHAAMTLNARARYREKMASKNSRVSLGFSDPLSAKPRPYLASTPGAATLCPPDASRAVLPSLRHASGGVAATPVE
jgi:hypothetical protein